VELTLGELRVRALSETDAPLVVEATAGEQGRSLWGHRPVGAYSLADARAALRAWEQDVSFGVLRGDRLVAAVGLMPDAPDSAELAYWVRPDERGRGLAVLAVRAMTEWAHQDGGLTRLWLEINPANAASLVVAERAGYRYESRLPDHCRSWTHEDPDQDSWHDCLIWVHESVSGS
jgi:RimJ/RimL family protein N-acetyltransferase